jgi:hypothetical protein
MRKEKEIQVVQIEKEQTRLSLFTDGMILYFKGPKTPLENSVVINNFSKL